MSTECTEPQDDRQVLVELGDPLDLSAEESSDNAEPAPTLPAARKPQRSRRARGRKGLEPNPGQMVFGWMLEQPTET